MNPKNYFDDKEKMIDYRKRLTVIKREPNNIKDLAKIIFTHFRKKCGKKNIDRMLFTFHLEQNYVFCTFFKYIEPHMVGLRAEQDYKKLIEAAEALNMLLEPKNLGPGTPYDTSICYHITFNFSNLAKDYWPKLFADIEKLYAWSLLGGDKSILVDVG